MKLYWVPVILSFLPFQAAGQHNGAVNLDDITKQIEIECGNFAAEYSRSETSLAAKAELSTNFWGWLKELTLGGAAEIQSIDQKGFDTDEFLESYRERQSCIPLVWQRMLNFKLAETITT
ncbi:hypothetical protein [Rubrimonas cliftonensis]|uniref:hypothetical protein n=1 Tax=Rubrimonas cliftonensis TaxID=89524 RepID=UPI0011149E52|nr:hypothetical protein [Rubrimonas cliftonensis]